MYQEKPTAEKKKTTISTDKQANELSLEKALEAIKEQAHTYKHAGMTHISSLLA